MSINETKTNERSEKYCMSKVQKKPKYADLAYAQEVPESCDLCHKNISQMDFYADAQVPGGHQWGFLCQVCIAEKKLTFSPESGKLYQKQKNPEHRKEWLLVAGQVDEPRDCVEPLYNDDGIMYGYVNENAELILFDEE